MLELPIAPIADSQNTASARPAGTPDLKAIATEMISASQVSLIRHGARLREGKSAADLRDALKKARAFGRGREDFTLAMLEAHLKHLVVPAQG